MCMFPLAIGGQTEKPPHPKMSPSGVGIKAVPKKVISSARPLDELSTAQNEHAAGRGGDPGVVRRHGSTAGKQRVWFWGNSTAGPEYVRLMFVSLSTALNVPVTATADGSVVTVPLKLNPKLTPLPPELMTCGTQVRQSDEPATIPDPCADTVCALALSAKNAGSVSNATTRLRLMPVASFLLAVVVSRRTPRRRSAPPSPPVCSRPP